MTLSLSLDLSPVKRPAPPQLYSRSLAGFEHLTGVMDSFHTQKQNNVKVLPGNKSAFLLTCRSLARVTPSSLVCSGAAVRLMDLDVASPTFTPFSSASSKIPRYYGTSDTELLLDPYCELDRDSMRGGKQEVQQGGRKLHCYHTLLEPCRML